MPKRKCCVNKRMLLSSPDHCTDPWSLHGAWEKCYLSS